MFKALAHPYFHHHPLACDPSALPLPADVDKELMLNNAINEDSKKTVTDVKTEEPDQKRMRTS